MKCKFISFSVLAMLTMSLFNSCGDRLAFVALPNGEEVAVDKAREIFEDEVVRSLEADDSGSESLEHRLFYPGDVIPLWNKAMVVDNGADGGHGSVCVPISTSFVYAGCYDVKGGEITDKDFVYCHSELLIRWDKEKCSCSLVYSLGDRDCADAQKNGLLGRIRNGDKYYSGLLLFTDLNGTIRSVFRLDKGVTVKGLSPDKALAGYRFRKGVRMTTGLTKNEFEDETYWVGKLDPSYCIDYYDRGMIPISSNTSNPYDYTNLGPTEGLSNDGAEIVTKMLDELTSTPTGNGNGSNPPEQQNEPTENKVEYDKEKDFVSYEKFGASGCMKASKAFLNNLGKVADEGRGRLYIVKKHEKTGEPTVYKDIAAAAVQRIISGIDDGNPSIAGVSKSDFKKELAANTNDPLTQHFIVITAYKRYGDGSCDFIYIETGRSQKRWEEATSDNNILHYHPDTGYIEGMRTYADKQGDIPHYIVTEMRNTTNK